MKLIETTLAHNGIDDGDGLVNAVRFDRTSAYFWILVVIIVVGAILLIWARLKNEP